MPASASWVRPAAISEATPGVIDEQQVDVLALQAVVIVQAFGVDEGYVALAVLVMIFSAPALTCSARSDSVARAWVNGTTSLAEMPMEPPFGSCTCAVYLVRTARPANQDGKSPVLGGSESTVLIKGRAAP